MELVTGTSWTSESIAPETFESKRDTFANGERMMAGSASSKVQRLDRGTVNKVGATCRGSATCAHKN